MRLLSLISLCSILLAAAACDSSSSNDVSDPEIRSQGDVQQLFETIMPDLVAAFSEFANSQAPVASASTAAKQDGTSTIPCPQGGSLIVSPSTGQATLAACIVRGVTIAGDLSLFVQPLGSVYQASFFGPLTVTGTFNGTIEVIDSLIEWSDPPSEENTFWTVTVYIEALNQTFTVMSGSSGGGGNERCQQACASIQAACMSTEADCVGDCSSDFASCPVEMGILLDCIAGNAIQCDPEQDQGLAEDPCRTEHDMVQACGKDPF